MRLKAGHILPPTSDQGQAAEFFARRVKELTKGEIEIQVFHAGELGKSIPSQLENLVLGASLGPVHRHVRLLQGMDPRFGVVNTPFVFRHREHFKKFLASDLFNAHGPPRSRSAASCSSARVTTTGCGAGRPRAAHAHADPQARRPEGLSTPACSRPKRRSRRGPRSAPTSRLSRGRTPTRRWPPGPSTGSRPRRAHPYPTKQTEAVRFFTNVAGACPEKCWPRAPAPSTSLRPSN